MIAYPIDEIAGALKMTRREFGGIFLAAQVWIPMQHRIEFETIAAGTPHDSDAFKLAFKHSIRMQFIHDLIFAAAQSGLETGFLSQLLIKEMGANGSTLQSIQNAARGFTDPVPYYSGIMQSTRWTAKVLIDGRPEGTGVLIGPNLFLTAWHVTKSLFDALTGKPLYEKDIHIEFDNFIDIRNGKLRPSTPMLVSAHQNWYITHSCCHDEELNNDLPTPRHKLDGFWDYTILRLKKAVGFERSWAKLDKRAVLPPQNGKIILFQHPAGQPLRIDQSELKNLNPPDPAVPGFRFLHDVNTVNGSSGGPCFDKEFSLVGLHQGSWPPQCNALINYNRGVPMTRIAEDIRQKIQELPLPDPGESPFWCINKKNCEPIIGCDSFQAALWESFAFGKYKLFELKGPEGNGKSFLSRVAFTVLNDTQNLKIDCPAEIIAKHSVPKFIDFIGGCVGSRPAGMTNKEDYDSTPAAWLRGIALPAIVGLLDQKRAGRIVWLNFSELNKFDIEGPDLSEFLFLLYEHLKQVDWLRIILDGMTTNLPLSVQPYSYTYQVTFLTRQDIESCINKLFADLDIHDHPGALASFLFAQYTTNLNTNPIIALQKLNQLTIDYMSYYLKSI